MEHAYFDTIKAQGYVSSSASSPQKLGEKERDSISSSPKSDSTDSGDTSACRRRSHSNAETPLDAAQEKLNEAPLHIRRNVSIDIFRLFLINFSYSLSMWQFVMEVMNYVANRKDPRTL